MRQRRPGLLALVDDDVDIRRIRVRAHPLAPDRHRRLDLVGLELGQRADRVGRVDDHLVGAERRLRREQVRLAATARERVPVVLRCPGDSAG